jgi:hypothetical protein
MTQIIVLQTSGVNEFVTIVKIKLFDTKEEAIKYCEQRTDTNKDKTYWTFCDIIEEGLNYEPTRYENYSRF